jgi:hypothetical protein
MNIEQLKYNCAYHISEGFQTVSLPPMLSKASWEQLLLYLVPGWHKNGTQLPQLKWPGNQITEKDKIEKVPGWQEKGTQLLRKKFGTLSEYLACQQNQ